MSAKKKPNKRPYVEEPSPPPQAPATFDQEEVLEAIVSLKRVMDICLTNIQKLNKQVDLLVRNNMEISNQLKELADLVTSTHKEEEDGSLTKTDEV